VKGRRGLVGLFVFSRLDAATGGSLSRRDAWVSPGVQVQSERRRQRLTIIRSAVL
jgi:hypothetical protein